MTNESKKILVTSTTFPRWEDDTTPRFVYDLSKNLASKYSIIALAPHYKGALKREKTGNLNVRRFSYFKPESMQKLAYDGGIIPNMRKSFLAKMQMPLLISAEFFNACKIIKKEKINLIHAHWTLPQGFVGVFLKKKFRIPLLVTVHGSDLFPLKSKLLKKLQNFVFKNADHITVNSIATKNELLSRFPRYNYKLSTIPMGIDTRIFKKIRIKKPNNYKNNKILLFVGRLSDQKCIQYLIESLKYLYYEFPQIKLLIIGEGPYEKELKWITNKNKLNNYVDFLGPIPFSELAKYYNFADIFILPSLSTNTGTEALGLTIIEAMASGCAVIGANVGGIRYLVKNMDNGILVNEKDPIGLAKAIKTLLKNKKLAIKLGKNAAYFARKDYSWDKITKDFAKIYDNLLK